MTAVSRSGLSRPHRRWLYLSVWLVFLSGFAWLLMHYGAIWTTGEDRLRPLEVVTMKVHGAAVILVLIALGSLIPQHISRGLHADRNRAFGISLLAAAIVLTITGYALYYSGSETLRAVAGDLHSVTGLAVAAVFLAHVRSATARQRKGFRRARSDEEFPPCRGPR